MTQQELQQVKDLLSKRTTEQLVEIFEMTNDKSGKYVHMVRGWIMDEFKKRDPAAFDKWMDDFTNSLRKYYLG